MRSATTLSIPYHNFAVYVDSLYEQENNSTIAGGGQGDRVELLGKAGAGCVEGIKAGGRVIVRLDSGTVGLAHAITRTKLLRALEQCIAELYADRMPLRLLCSAITSHPIVQMIRHNA